MSDIRGLTKAGEYEPVRQNSLGALHVSPPRLQYINDSQVTSTGTGLNALVIPPGAIVADIQVTAADIYFDFGNASTTPASTQGQEAYMGDHIYVYGPTKLLQFRAVRQASVNFTLKIFWYSELLDE